MISGASFEVVVVGGGVAGLTAAAELTHRSLRTLVLERHNVPGGCASFYQRGGFRFDVGATLAGGFGSRGLHRTLNVRYGLEVSNSRVEPAMLVHLPDARVARFGDERWPVERVRAFGEIAEPFWQRQEHIADLAWDFAANLPPLPADFASAIAFARAVKLRHIGLLGTIGRSVEAIVPAGVSQRFKTFLDVQLLITAQAEARDADLAYGATALDLAREGSFHLAGGIAAISISLARAIRRGGSQIAYNREAVAIETSRGRVRGVRLNDGSFVAAKRVIVALPANEIVELCPDVGAAFRARAASRPQRWGAFVVYCGLAPGAVPPDLAAHHQIVGSYGEPLGEGNSVFLSFSDAGDRTRARDGGRAVTLSTHTDVARWERAERDGSGAALRARYESRLLDALASIVPGAQSRIELVENATPATFARFTGRSRGLVGGFPQVPFAATLGAFGAVTPVRGLFLAGDTTFPGQSTVGAAASGFAAAQACFSSSVARNFARSMM